MSIGTLAPPSAAVGGDGARGAESSRAWRKITRNPAALAGAGILLLVIGAAIFAPYVAPHDPARQSLLRRFTPPVWAQGAAPFTSAPTRSAATSSAGSSTARVSLVVGTPRCWSAHDRRRPWSPERLLRGAWTP